MKKIFLLFVSCWIINTAFAQLGFNTGTQFMQAPKWKNAIIKGYNLSPVEVFQPALYLGVDIALSMKKVRMRWLPELSFSRYDIDIPYYVESDDPSFIASGQFTDHYDARFISFFFNADLFILNFKKPSPASVLVGEEAWLKKNLFIRVAPGISLVQQSNFIFFTNSIFSGPGPRSTFRNPNPGGSFNFKIGMGIDFHITDFVTISPIINGSISTTVYWRGLGEPKVTPSSLAGFATGSPLLSPQETANSVLHLFGGLRMGINLKK